MQTHLTAQYVLLNLNFTHDASPVYIHCTFCLCWLFFSQEEYDQARSFFQAAADKGDSQAQFQMGVLLYDGLGGEPDRVRT